MRLIDADELINQGYEIVVDGWQYDTCNKSIDIDNIPTAYSVNKVVEELEETMQDLNVIEILSHIDFDRTIQIGLDNFLKSYNSELLRIVKHGGVTDDACEWRLCDEEANVYDTSCRNPHILIEGTPRENNYSYCPYCGKKIKVVD